MPDFLQTFSIPEHVEEIPSDEAPTEDTAGRLIEELDAKYEVFKSKDVAFHLPRPITVIGTDAEAAEIVQEIAPVYSPGPIQGKT
ncbi:MAG: hypothetical protein QF486_03835 [Candidatus Woesearchaeota archaeon]|jgi:hypothetical protein|nr:hypothetical protein [Candidatus Woesearchaeota archaeon]MDP7181638.1 hypothetical protein [Candidatus Woesearchaeota archaeon]MDP7198727.1 hypothetical protein [Candidatus Woesearchaeota archaeon]MDP7467273.1 hypothetical protein [Candidatus Woesearchaeota archaeon]MDP7647392.1 hypothetical protein [Candidatus Woesearchaeota archaeon]